VTVVVIPLGRLLPSPFASVKRLLLLYYYIALERRICRRRGGETQKKFLPTTTYKTRKQQQNPAVAIKQHSALDKISCYSRLLLFESTRCCCIGPIQFISYYICASVRQSQTAASRKDESENGPSVRSSVRRSVPVCNEGFLL
jgi:hypothetical protein